MRQTSLTSYNNWFILLLAFAVTLTTPVSCNKKEPLTNTDFYYVKYEVTSQTIRHGGKLDVIVGDVDSKKSYTVNTRSPWEINVGPVSRNFFASIQVNKSGTPDSDLRLQAKISVSKNNEPFVLKRDDNSDVRRNSLSMDYLVGD